MDAQKDFPPTNVPLETEKGVYYFFKADIFGKSYTYILQGNAPSSPIAVPVSRVKEILRLNKRGKRPESIVSLDHKTAAEKDATSFQNMVGQEDLTRFDKPKNKGRKKRRTHQRNPRRKQNSR